MKHRLLTQVFVMVFGFFLPFGAAANSLVDVIADSGVGPDDFAMMQAEARQLYEPPQKAGAERSWSNPRTGSEGRVILRSVRDGCVELMHLVRKTTPPHDLKHRVWRCRGTDGRWLLTVRPN